ncbi:sugar transferase [Thermoproteota archaeon]
MLPKHSFYRKYGKRCFDVFWSILGLIFLSPVFIFIAVFIKLSSSGPVIYKQERIGKSFKLFRLYKFRTMIDNAQTTGPAVTQKGDPRITRIGRFLRVTKMDELPQLFNVLKGDMSLVGPRPEIDYYVSKFKVDYKDILKIKPGITDYAALFFRNEEAVLGRYSDFEQAYQKEILPKKIELYKTYLSQISLLTDLKLILLTVFPF